MSKYTEAFKMSVIKKHLEEKIPVRQLSRDLEINISLIKLWALIQEEQEQTKAKEKENSEPAAN